MVDYLLDTGFIILYINLATYQKAKEILIRCAETGRLYISTITRFEILAGTEARYQDRNIATLNSFGQIDVNVQIADKAGSLFRKYKEKGVMVDNEDLILAASSIIHSCLLLTSNRRHFPFFSENRTWEISYKTKGGEESKKIVYLLDPKEP